MNVEKEIYAYHKMGGYLSSYYYETPQSEEERKLAAARTLQRAGRRYVARSCLNLYMRNKALLAATDTDINMYIHPSEHQLWDAAGLREDVQLLLREIK